jgi:hypothetical protein
MRPGHEERITVKCVAEYRGEQRPCAFTIGKEEHRIAEVPAQCLSPDHDHFKVKADDGNLYILKHNRVEDTWEMTFFRRSQPF